MKFWLLMFTFILMIALIWASGAMAFTLYALNINPQSPNEDTQAIVVLTGGRDRVEKGLELFANDMAPELFISGVNTDVKDEEILALYKGEKALPFCCMTLGYKARSTMQNAIETKEWLAKTEFKSIRLVTGNYHMPRAMMEMRHALPEIQIYAHPVEQINLKEDKKRLMRLLLSEYHKTVYRYIGLTFGLDNG
ncbi:MAG: YdcF family protein [Micavibrio sp.]|nr:YdcF family protein [Micavibrio sp.]